MNQHEIYMLRCLELAKNARANVAPNPMVGSVIVCNGKIIGEGYHQLYGEAHAEVNAIQSVENQELLKDSTLYVNLEPCAHHGKTPPCSNLIIEKQIPRVVIGCQDSFSEVSGKGIEKMRKAGIEVIVGILEKESRELNKRFFTFHEQKRPYIILKWAETLDGFMDMERSGTFDPHINWITHTNLKVPVHKWRSEEMGIMVGTMTAKNDNPRLDTREWKGINPLRILIDENLDLPENLHLFDGSIHTLVFTAHPKENSSNLEFVVVDFSTDFLVQVFQHLYERNIQSVLVEGGQFLLQSIINHGVWDEARILIGNKTFGKGLTAPKLHKIADEDIFMGNDKLLFFRNNTF